MRLTNWLESVFKRMGLVRPFDDDDLINASMEDKLRDYEKQIDKVRYETRARVETNQKLRRTIADAQRRTKSFEALEHLINRGEHH